MCRTVYIPRENAMDLEVTTIGALRSALGVPPIIRDGYPQLPDDSCLCPCDIEATAEAAGWDIFGIGSCKVEGSFDRNYMVRDNLICMLEGIEDAICNMLEQEAKA